MKMSPAMREDLRKYVDSHYEELLSQNYPRYSIASVSFDEDMPASLEDILEQREPTFSEYLMELLRERSGRDSEVYKRAEVSKQLFSRILSDMDYHPARNTVIQLAFGLQLDLQRTQKLLETAGYALSRSSKADLVVQYFLERKLYDLSYVNEALYDFGLPLLSTGLRA